jgi:hypothetical protein
MIEITKIKEEVDTNRTSVKTMKEGITNKIDSKENLESLKKLTLLIETQTIESITYMT